MGGTVLVDEHGELAERLGIRGVPANVFVDSDGTVTAVGGATPADLEAAARQLLGPEAVTLAAPGEPAAEGMPDIPGMPDMDGIPGAPGIPGVDEGRIERHLTSWESRRADSGVPGATGPEAPGGTPEPEVREDAPEPGIPG